MSRRNGQLSLGEFLLFTGHHVAAWRYPDALSQTRAGWNLVTSSKTTSACNFAHDGAIPHADRYDRAEEFADVVTGLWDSWDDDVFMCDRASGQHFDPQKMHRPNHRGHHFSVQGPLNIARSPQGHPVVVQAGSSEPGKELAALTAEAIFAAQQTRSASAQTSRAVNRR